MQPELAGKFASRLALLMATAAALSSCMEVPRFKPPAQPPVTTATPQVPLVPGQSAQAAVQDEARARGRSGNEQARLQLRAAREWLDAGRGADATRVLNSISAAMTAEQIVQRRLLEAQITLAAGHPQQAWGQMQLIAEPVGTPTARPYLEVRQQLALAAGRPIDAVRAEGDAERLTSSIGERSGLRRELLAGLRQLHEQGITLEAPPGTDPIVRGWLDLATLTAGARSSASELSQWRANNPDHPATELLAQIVPAAVAAGRLAVLLPVTTRPEAALIRDGFQYACDQQDNAQRAQITVYDTDELGVPAALAQARSDGAEMIVGPLTRDEVVAAAEARGGGAPLLALNLLPPEHSVPPNFYQFALSPEDEARALAVRILASGGRRGAVITAAGEYWSQRILGAFSQQLLAGGGVILTQDSFDPNEHDYSTAIRHALGTDLSVARLERLKAVTGAKLLLEPRRRNDLDFVLVAGPAASVRLLRPQLRFQYAGDLTIYSTSDAYDPAAAESNQDLEGLLYGEMPWLVPDNGRLDALHSQIEQASGGSTSSRSRLYAFGYDACQLALGLAAAHGDYRQVSVAGLTGELSFDADRHVQRSPLWVQVHNGLPRPAPPLNPAALTTAGH
jgi:outer membrane PBP1 activator LpoA protein